VPHAHHAVPGKGRGGVFISEHWLLHGRTLAAGWFARFTRIAWQAAARSGKQRLNAAHDGSAPLGDGTRSAARVAENTAAADLTFAQADLEEIARVLPNGGFGARYADGRIPSWT
jgi:hypothetical protein